MREILDRMNDFGVGFLFAMALSFLIMACVEFYNRHRESKKLRDIFERIKHDILK